LGNSGCNGGSQGLAFEYAQTKGIGAEASYPKYKLAVVIIAFQSHLVKNISKENK
jgi:hypothetical protein